MGDLDIKKNLILPNNIKMGNAVIVGYADVSLATLQLPIIVAMQIAGYRVAILLPNNQIAAADYYLKIGANKIISLENLTLLMIKRVHNINLDKIQSNEDLLKVKYKNIAVGKYILSTLMRKNRVSKFDLKDVEIRRQLVDAYKYSCFSADLANLIIKNESPDLILMIDRGYTPDGEFFDAAIQNGINVITMNSAHKSGSLIFKKYNKHNQNLHFGTPSYELWKALREFEWTDTHWKELSNELDNCYANGSWYDEVGTQVNKNHISSEDLKKELGLDPTKKIAAIFPHLFWDATFFWGTDLFSDYEEWFTETLKVMASNKKCNWIVKIHPANIIKNNRDGYIGEYSEIRAIKKTLGDIPNHIKIIGPESNISTNSLFQIIDYCITVRGTVGLEAAITGKKVLTAGTGRYDGLGFTDDSSTKEQYLEKIKNITSIPKMSKSEIELARRYAYGFFIVRTLETKILNFYFLNDKNATLCTELKFTKNSTVNEYSDIKQLASWLSNGSFEEFTNYKLLVN